MKKYTILLLLGLSSFLNTQAQNFTEIKGVSKRSTQEPVKLYRVVYGRMEEMATISPAANGEFGFSFKPDYKGYYVIGFGHPVQGMQDKYKLYVKGNEKINLELNDSTYVLTGVNTKENQVLEQWHKLTSKMERKSIYFTQTVSTYVDFFPVLEATVAKAKNWTNGKETGNADFDKLMQTAVNYDLAFLAMTFLRTPRSLLPSKDDYTGYLKNFNADQFMLKDDLYKFPYGMRVLNFLVWFKNHGLGKYDADKSVMSIPNDKFKGEFVLSMLADAKSYTQYLEITDKYGNYFLTEDQKARSQAILAKLATTIKPGEKAINFTYPDSSGKQVSLTDYKGKIVLVDVWATWCGPCKKEIPALKELEKEFHDKDVVFMSVSLDKEKDKEIWKKFVADEHLSGVQLFANGWSQIAQVYGIISIPRFMLFDRGGNVVNVDAPRPSNPKLKETLIDLLSKSYSQNTIAK